MNHGRVVAVAYQLTNTTGRHLRVFLGKIHGDLSNLYIVALTALAEHILLIDIVMAAHLLQNIVDGERMVVDLNGTLDDTLSQPHVNA